MHWPHVPSGGCSSESACQLGTAIVSQGDHTCLHSQSPLLPGETLSPTHPAPQPVLSLFVISGDWLCLLNFLEIRLLLTIPHCLVVPMHLP